MELQGSQNRLIPKNTPPIGCNMDREVLHFFLKSERAVKWGKGCKQGECNELNHLSFRNTMATRRTLGNSDAVYIIFILDPLNKGTAWMSGYSMCK